MQLRWAFSLWEKRREDLYQIVQSWRQVGVNADAVVENI